MSSSTAGPVSASVGRRIGAWLIDAVIAGVIFGVALAVLAAVLTAVAAPTTTSALVGTLTVAYTIAALIALAWWLVYTAMQAGAGSIGQRILGLCLVDERTGSGPIGFGRAFLRNLIFALAASIVLGYFSPLFDPSPRRQGWHDRVGRAVVASRASAAVDDRAFAAPADDDLPAPSLRDAPVIPVPWAGVPAAEANPLPPTSLPSAEATTLPPAPMSAAAPSAAPAPRVISEVPGMISEVPGIVHAAPAAASAAEPASVAAPASAVEPVPHPLDAAAPVPQADLDETVVSPPRERALVALTWDSGERTAVYRRTLFGRNPAAEQDANSIPVRDETLSLSKTHFEVDGDSSSVWVVDRHSTNGTVVVRAGERIAVEPGRRTPIAPGDRLEFGDRSVEIGEPA